MAVAITDVAIGKLKELMTTQGLDAGTTFLRMGIKGGGCSGLSYLLEFDPHTDEHDKKFEIQGITVVIDKKSYIYLNGTELDFVTQGLSGGFVFNNPNAKSSCGCGTSFAT